MSLFHELAPAVKNMERLAADFSADPKEILPEPKTLGPEQVKAAVQADKQWEQVEKGCKRLRRSFNRDGR